MARRSKWESLSDAVRDLLRNDILGAEWAPGARLPVGRLAERYETSTTVVREALTRLAGERLVRFSPNHGFFVAELSLDELRDLTELRCRVEAFGIALAVERGDLAWESELIAIHHTLERTPRRRPDDPHHITDEWFVAHQAFHAKLLEPCRLAVLTDLAATLADATALYRQWAAASPQAEARDIEAEHRAILDAVLARDADEAARLLHSHYTLSVTVIEAAELLAPEPATRAGTGAGTAAGTATRTGAAARPGAEPA